MKSRYVFAVLALVAAFAGTARATLQVGEPAPDFGLPDSAGNVHHLSDFRGQVVHILFWENF
ncbi:MAG: redoxin domain-containing protein [candidate division WOR-3 bacterium]